MHRQRPEVARSSLDPIIQGMTSNASGGPRSACGTPFKRVGRGLLVLDELPEGAVVESGPQPASDSGPRRWGARRRAKVDPRIAGLIEGFVHYVEAYDRFVPFQRTGQYAEHRRVIEARRRFAGVRAAASDREFLRQVQLVLRRWGIGVRGSRLQPLDEFAASVGRSLDGLEAVERSAIDHPELDIALTARRLWKLVDGIDVVTNQSRIVAGTKMLHHLLPEVVPPMDRAWTGAFFGWTPQDPQNDQERTFVETYRSFAHVAEQVKPSLHVGAGWRTSSTKVLDNALIGYCMEHDIGPGASGGELEAASPQEG